MSKIECFFYLTEAGKSPVEEFIKSLDSRGRRKFYYTKSLLETFGHNLTYPHAKYIGDDIFELRFKAMEGHVRTLYFFYSGNQAIFTNGFIKKSGKTPQNEEQTAMDRRKDYLQRIGD
jgi:phage-related protein